MIYKTAEEARAYVQSLELKGEPLELSIAADMTFAGKPDKIGAGMAIIVDALLGQGYFPDSFEQREGYRVYRYKAMK